jgi:dolichol-phosphate mannosyltransferase
MQENSQKLQGSVEILKLSRNFRDGGGLKAGLSRASGDALVLMSADLQDHPNFISNFLRLWEDGYKNVYAEIESRNGAKFLRQINSKIFYKVAFILSGKTITQNASDFRLLDRSVYEALRMAPEYNKFLRGYISWLGFSSIGVKQHRPNRFAGESKAGTIDTINYALKGILSNSSVPLRLVSLANLILCISQLIYFFSALISGSTSDKILTYLMNTLIAFSFVIISEYMIVIYQETKHRPQFIVEDILPIKKS